MNRQQQIDDFLLKAHQLAVARLREEPQRLQQAAELLQRWRERNAVTRSDPYRQEWERLIAQGVDAIERDVCANTDHAAALRNVSPLSAVISQQERSELLRAARSVA